MVVQRPPDGPKRPPDGPKRPQDGPKRRQDGVRVPNNPRPGGMREAIKSAAPEGEQGVMKHE